MDLKMRLKRLPIQQAKKVTLAIREQIHKNVSQIPTEPLKEPLEPSILEAEIEVNLDLSYTLSQDDIQLLTQEWAKGEQRVLPAVSIHSLFEEQAKQKPHKAALFFNEETMTYEELNNKANQLARVLQNKGAKPNQPIAIYLERSINMVMAVLAVLKTGASYVPLDPHSPTERVKNIIANARPQFVISSQSLKDNLDVPNSLMLYIKDLEAEASGISSSDLCSLQAMDNQAYIIYTSGSTGTPKGVQIKHSSLVNFVVSISEAYDITAQDTLIQFASLAFDVSVFDIFAALCNGASLCIANENERKSPELLTRLMQRKGVTVAELPPALLPLLDPEGFPSLRLISVGGEKFAGELVDRWATSSRRFMNGYGPTETTVAVTLFECKGQWKKNPPIGRPIPNANAYVLNHALQPMPIEVPGELCIGGICIAEGYLGLEELTAERFVKNPFDNDPSSLIYRTGDLARWLPDGNLEILGRVDRQLKLRGFRIELEEIESILVKLPFINQATVEPYQDELGNNQLVAYIVADYQQTISTTQLREHLSQFLPSYMIPAKYMTLDALPVTLNGKIDRKALPKPDASALQSDHLVAPRNELELRIAEEVFQPILGLRHIGVTDNFFDMGGNSLQATSVVSKLRELFTIEVNLIDFFQSPTIEALSQIVKKQESYNEDKRADLLIELNEVEEAWIKMHKAPSSKFRLVCFPYAGSNGYIFKNWPDKLAPDIEIVTIELPGHGTKIKQAPFDVAFDVANRLASELEALADKPMFVLGHSGGAILAFESCRLLAQRGAQVQRLFALASRAPHVPLKEASRYHLPKEQFLSRVNEFGGLSKEFLNNKDLLDLMLPAMRADEKLAEVYRYEGSLKEIQFPITVYGGDIDQVLPEHLMEWSQLNPVDFEYTQFPGGHFFLQDCEDEVLLALIESIARTQSVLI